MTKIAPINKDQGKVLKILETYFNIAEPEEIEKIKYDIFYPAKPISERRNSYVNHKKSILQLKTVFKKIIKENNEIARHRGYLNFWEYLNLYRIRKSLNRIKEDI